MGHFSKAWSTVSSFPSLCVTVFDGKFMFGSSDGMVYQGFTGFLDGSSYDETIPGSEITGMFQTGFYDLGTPTANKRVQRIRLLGIADGIPGYIASVRSEYDLTLGTTPPDPPAQNIVSPLWDVAIWDQAYWQARATTLRKWFGVAGFGKKLAVQMAVRGRGSTLITDYELTFEEGIGL
jgi:hypothetical protein